jgi:hypothetical protein
MEHILNQIVAEDAPNADCTVNALTKGKGAGWMVGSRTVRGSDAINLLRLSLLRRAECSDDFAEYWWRGPEVEKILTNPSYVPQIVQHWQRTAAEWAQVERDVAARAKALEGESDA